MWEVFMVPYMQPYDGWDGEKVRFVKEGDGAGVPARHRRRLQAVATEEDAEGAGGSLLGAAGAARRAAVLQGRHRVSPRLPQWPSRQARLCPLRPE